MVTSHPNEIDAAPGEVRSRGIGRGAEPLRLAMLGALSGILFITSFRLFAVFLPAFTWAVTFALVVSGPRRGLMKRLGRNAAAAATVLLVVVGLVLPFALLVNQVSDELGRIVPELSKNGAMNAWNVWAESYPWLGRAFNWLKSHIDVASIAQDLIKNVTERAGPILLRSFSTAAQAAITLFFLFFFVRDQEVLVQALRERLPLLPEETEELFSRVSSAIYASVYGRTLVAIIQGFLGGLIFWMTGVEGPVFWGAVMACCAILPVAGAYLVWVPVALFLILSDAWVRALIIAAWGIVVINPVDNVLYPHFVANRMGLHPLLLFVALVGGLFLFGFPGIILGPVVITASIVFAEIWRSRIKALDEAVSRE